MGTYSSFSPPTTTRPPCHTRYYCANRAATLPFVTPPICSRCNRALCTATRVGFSTGERKSLIGSPFFLAVFWSASVTALDLHIPQSFPIFCCQYRYAQHHISLSGYIRHVWSVCFYSRIFSLGRFWYGYLGCMTSPLPFSLSFSLSLSLCVCVSVCLSNTFAIFPQVLFCGRTRSLIFVGSFFFNLFLKLFWGCVWMVGLQGWGKGRTGLAWLDWAGKEVAQHACAGFWCFESENLNSFFPSLCRGTVVVSFTAGCGERERRGSAKTPARDYTFRRPSERLLRCYSLCATAVPGARSLGPTL